MAAMDRAFVVMVVIALKIKKVVIYIHANCKKNNPNRYVWVIYGIALIKKR